MFYDFCQGSQTEPEMVRLSRKAQVIDSITDVKRMGHRALAVVRPRRYRNGGITCKADSGSTLYQPLSSRPLLRQSED